MLKEIVAKSLLSRVKGPDPWFGLYYGLNLYRGCQHRCIYCDSRSECYSINDFDREVLIKSNALELLGEELSRKRVVGTIGTGSMNDPYMPVEARMTLTRRALAVIQSAGFPVHVITKGTLVLRDVDLLLAIQRQTYAAVSLTITTADDGLSRKVEPGAPPSSERFAALRSLRQSGLLAGITLMPVLPFLEDSEENIEGIVRRAHESGASYIIAATGMTLRDRQRDYYYAQLDRLFPGLRARYEKTFGNQYSAPSPAAERLQTLFLGLCRDAGIATSIPVFTPFRRKPVRRNDPAQPQLFA